MGVPIWRRANKYVSRATEESGKLWHSVGLPAEEFPLISAFERLKTALLVPPLVHPDGHLLRMCKSVFSCIPENFE